MHFERVAACRWSAMPTGEDASFGDIKYHAPIRGSKVRRWGCAPVAAYQLVT
jgi:hypothetical protein